MKSRFSRQRRAMGYTQDQLAEALHIDRSTVHRWESGRNEPLPYLRPRLAALLNVTPQELEALIHAIRSRPAGTPTREGEQPSPLDDLRQAVIGRPASVEPVDTTALGPAVDHAHRLYQHADYDAAADAVTSLLPRLEHQPPGPSAAARRAGGYLAAAKLAAKLGDATLAWVTADRAHQAALESERPALVGVARYQVACALLRAGHLADARTVTADAVDGLARDDDPSAASARGALLLLSAVMTARGGDGSGARVLLGRAREVAEVLGGDGNHLWTAFGVTNVAIHELSVTVELGDSDRAEALGEVIDTDRLPAGLVGRRSQVHLDLGRAAADARDDGLAVLHLLEAERVAKQAVSRNVHAREVIGTVLARERRGATPGLRALARRAGVRG